MAAQAGYEAAPGGAAVGASLYVVGLDANVTDSQLYNLFSEFGEVVSVEVCEDLSIGLSLRYGYVHYRNPQCAQRALEELNFTPLNGKPIRIMHFHQEPGTSKSDSGIAYIKKSCSPDSSGQSMGYGSDEEFTEKGIKEHNDKANFVNVFVKNLCESTTEDDLENKWSLQKSCSPDSSGQSMDYGSDEEFTEKGIKEHNDKANFVNVFVKNLCESTTEDDLENKFGEFGLITSAVLMKNEDGTSKCFGFVNFDNAEDAARAVESLNGQIFGNKKWFVGRAQNKHERRKELKHDLECVKYAFDNRSNLFVKNLDRSIDDEKLKEIFSLFGSVTSCRVLRDEKGNSTKRGLVAFSSAKEAADALSAMNGKVLAGKPLCIAIAQRKEDRRAELQNLGKKINHPETFSSSGDILSCEVAKDTSGHSKGYGFVQFSGQATGQEAIGGLERTIGKFNGVIAKLSGIIGEFNGTVRELNGLLLNGKQVDMEHYLTKEIELLADKAHFTFVFVKNFCESTTEEDLKNIFGEFGLVTDTAVMRNEDGTSKCFGFVNFKNADDAARAVESLDGQRFDEKKLHSWRVQKRMERDLELKTSFEQSVKEAVDKQSNNIYVKNLNVSIGDENLKELFSSFGLVTSCKVLKDTEGRSKGSGFVAFSSAEEASRALCEMNGRILFGKPLHVALAQRKEDSKARLQNLDKEIDHRALALPDAFLSAVNTGSCKVATDATDRSMEFGSVHSGEESLQEAIGEHNGMLLNGKHAHAGSSHNEKERRLSQDKPYFKKLFVKNFCQSTSEDDLKKIFGEFGLVKSTVIMRNEDRSSKCFGYVKFENAEDAARAVESLNGQIFNERRWFVEIERKSFKRELKKKYQSESCVNEEVDKGSNICVENHSIPHGKLSEVFSPIRSFKSHKMMPDRNGISRKRGFTTLSPPKQAYESLSEENGKKYSSKPFHVAQSQRKEDRRAWLQGQPGFGYEARPLIHSKSVPLIQNKQQDLHSGGSRHNNAGPMQKYLRPAPATKQQMLPGGRHAYHCPTGGMLSVQYERGYTSLCGVVISQSIPVGALASSLANASSLNRGRCWMRYCTRILSSGRLNI